MNVRKNEPKQDETRFEAPIGAIMAVIAILAVALLQDPAWAAKADLPYEDAIDKFRGSLTGPVAQSLAIAGIFVTGGTLIFGGDLPNFVRSMCLVVLVLALLICGDTIIQKLYGNAKGGVILRITPSAANSTLPALQEEPRPHE